MPIKSVADSFLNNIVCVKRKHANGRKQQVLPPNASSNGGDASRVGNQGKGLQAGGELE